MNINKFVGLALLQVALLPACISTTKPDATTSTLHEFNDVQRWTKSPDKAVGMWYSVWYSDQGRYQWIDNFGINSKKQMMGDVDGDGYDDAVVFFDDEAEPAYKNAWYVAKADPSSEQFVNPGVWDYLGGNSSNQFVEDVNNDGKADAVIWLGSDHPTKPGNWKVSLSDGAQFNGNGTWLTNFGVNSKTQLMGDVNGDGKSDAVVFFDDGNNSYDGHWYVATSNGSGFDRHGSWIPLNTFGENSTHQLLGDVDGDGKDDIVAWFGNDAEPAYTGKAYVSLSNGSSFQYDGRWLNVTDCPDAVCNADKVFLAQVKTADSPGLDLVFYKANPGGSWYYAKSKVGTDGTLVFAKPKLWKINHGELLENNAIPKTDFHSTTQLVGNIHHNGLDSPIVWGEKRGRFWALPPENDNGDGSSYYKSAFSYNTWESMNMNYRPTGMEGVMDNDGDYATYSSYDVETIDRHLDEIHAAGVDFIILDVTNGLFNVQGVYWDSAIVVAERITERLAAGIDTPKYIMSIGELKKDDANDDSPTMYPTGCEQEPQVTCLHYKTSRDFEQEAYTVYKHFIGNSERSGGYYTLDGKPVLVNYFAKTKRYNDWWDNCIEESCYQPSTEPDFRSADYFTIRYAGNIKLKFDLGSQDPHLLDQEFPFVPLQPTMSEFWGWGGIGDHPQGYAYSNPTMVVQPGWWNKDNVFFPRGDDGNAATPNYYDEQWAKVFDSSLVDTVIVFSYNEYFEVPAVAPTDTSLLEPIEVRSKGDHYNEKWDTADGYWNQTVEYICHFSAVDPDECDEPLEP